MRLLATLSVALLWTFDTQAQGLIWSKDFLGTGIGGVESGGPPGNRDIALDYVSDPFYSTPPSLNPVSGIFSMTISTNEAGRTFFANALNSPGFAGFVAGLTDGANDYIRITDTSSPFYGFLHEANFLGRSPATPD